jgi:hypothetical protein
MIKDLQFEKKKNKELMVIISNKNSIIGKHQNIEKDQDVEI